ncbi:probable insulin-like peptide 1 [Bactrocera dorsalis]|uniref:Probable insulin-like peptide 1 n=1 Tax=Bactrocera dorsalis TaxID=27457 RepID=A0A8N4QHV7_BACDO|nr:probable insulin-like peptide 1 [Bactrocera dorsalis]
MMPKNFLKICAVLIVMAALLPQGQSQRTVCGPALDAVLSTICVHGFNSKFKKSVEWDDLGNNEVDYELPFPYANSPFLAKIHGAQFDTLAKTRRHRHTGTDTDTVLTGVYDECCSKACSYNEILSYCNTF